MMDQKCESYRAGWMAGKADAFRWAQRFCELREKAGGWALAGAFSVRADEVERGYDAELDGQEMTPTETRCNCGGSHPVCPSQSDTGVEP